MSDTPDTNREPIFLEPGTGRALPNPETLAMDYPVLLKLSGRRTGGAFMVAELPMPPGQGPDPHIHDELAESFFVIEGTFEFRIGDRTVRAEPGAFLYAPRGVVHGFRNVGTAVARLLSIVAPPVVDLSAQTRPADA